MTRVGGTRIREVLWFKSSRFTWNYTKLSHNLVVFSKKNYSKYFLITEKFLRIFISTLPKSGQKILRGK